MATENVSHHAQGSTPQLARTMGLVALVVYGVGDMLGAGVYGLMGKYAGKMGNAVWLAFLASMVAAMLTGLSYASLGSRYPKAAGTAYISHRAFNWPLLTYVIGLATIASGLTSFATQSRAFAGYLLGFMGYSLPNTTNPAFPSALPPAAPYAIIGLAILFILALTAINFWGMRESTWLNMLCTAVEVGGLILLIIVGIRFWGSVNLLEVPQGNVGQSLTALAPAAIVGLTLQGAVLTFYSFIGFEDMINVTEEVKDPQRNFPRAVVLSLVITAVIYAAVAITAISVIPWQQLSESNQPMVDVVAKAAPWFPPVAFSVISLFAIANTALLNYIMGSRLIYGLARQGFLPRILSSIHPQRRTPHRAIFTLMLVVMALAVAGDISALAGATSTLLLFTFIIVNAALIVLQRRASEPKGQFEIPVIVPIGGILVCACMLGAAAFDPARKGSFLIAGILLAVIAVLYFILRPTNISEDTLQEAEHV